MLSAIQGFVKGILDGLPSPQLQPMQAVIRPPVDADAASSPIAYIWAGAFSMKRTSAPRPVSTPPTEVDIRPPLAVVV